MLQKYVFSIVSHIVYAFLLLAFYALFRKIGDSTPLVVAFVIGGFGLHVLKRFKDDVLLNEDDPVRQGPNVAGYLSADMIRALLREKSLTARNLLEASVSTPRGAFVLREIGLQKEEFLLRIPEGINDGIDAFDFLIDAVEQLPNLEETRVDANVVLYKFFKSGDVFTEILQ